MDNNIENKTTEFVVEKISEANYLSFFRIVQQNQWGNILLPNVYNPNLWGGIIIGGNNVIGGWVGTIRGNKPVVKWLAKSVYFDSYPTFVSEEVQQKYQQELIDTMREWAKQEHVVMFNLTHWVRGRNLPYLNVEHNATFFLPLQETSEVQWKLVESKQRNIVRKGEKNGVLVQIYNGKNAITKLPTLQKLRAQTQQHAIGKNSNASMLLKSDKFFENLIRNTDATLFIGYVEGIPATVAVMIASGETAYYYSGGSDYELNRQTGSSAYVIWKAIEYYRELPGVKYMDMGGVPVTPESSHPAYGVYAFKRSFGGVYMEFDAGVIPINRCKYALLRFALSQRWLLRLFSKSL